MNVSFRVTLVAKSYMEVEFSENLMSRLFGFHIGISKILLTEYKHGEQKRVTELKDVDLRQLLQDHAEIYNLNAYQRAILSPTILVLEQAYE